MHMYIHYCMPCAYFLFFFFWKFIFTERAPPVKKGLACEYVIKDPANKFEKTSVFARANHRIISNIYAIRIFMCINVYCT